MNILIILLGFSSYFFVKDVAQLYPLELILLMVFLLHLIRMLGLLKRDPAIRNFVLFGALWFLSQLLTDIVRDTDATDTAKGLSGIFFLIIGTLTLLELCAGRIERTVLLIVGAQLGGIIFASFSPIIQAFGNIWKWGYCTPVLYLTANYCGRFYEGRGWRPLVAPLLLSALAAFSFLMNARSIGAATAIVGVLLFVRIVFPGAVVSITTNMKNPYIAAIAGIAVLISVVALSLTMAALGKNGAFGQDAQVKWEAQDRGKYGFILGARYESIFSFSAIADSPIIGHGSVARDPKYRNLYWKLYDWGYTKSADETEAQLREFDDVIPAHSHLFGAWVWAGFAGFVFWIYILVRLGSALLLGLRSRTRYFPLLAMIVIPGMWNIFFSPFGGVTRVQEEIVLPFVFLFETRLKRVGAGARTTR